MKPAPAALDAGTVVARLLEDSAIDTMAPGTAEALDGLGDDPEGASPEGESDDAPSEEEVEAIQQELTPEQSQLVIDNENLIYAVAKKFVNVPGVEFEDLVSSARYAMIKAALTFKTGQGRGELPFGTYAARGMFNMLKNMYRKQDKYTKTQLTTLDGDADDDEGEEGAQASAGKDMIADLDRGSDVAGEVIRKEHAAVLRKLITVLKDPVERDILAQYLNGEEISNGPLAAKYSVGGSAIGMRRTRLLHKLADQLTQLGLDADSVRESADALLSAPHGGGIWSRIVRMLESATRAQIKAIMEGEFKLFTKKGAKEGDKKGDDKASGGKPWEKGKEKSEPEAEDSSVEEAADALMDAPDSISEAAKDAKNSKELEATIATTEKSKDPATKRRLPALKAQLKAIRSKAAK